MGPEACQDRDEQFADSPAGVRWLPIWANCCGKPPGGLGKTPGEWGKLRSIRTADDRKSHKTWAATRQVVRPPQRLGPTSSNRLAQGARPERVVGVGVRSMVMVVPRARGVIVIVGVIMGMGMATHR